MKPGAKPFEGAACEKRFKSWLKYLKLKNKWPEVLLINQSDWFYEDFSIWYYDCGYKKIIALGNNASKALKGLPHFKLPHPSGLNRQTNDKKFINQKLRECRKWLNS